MSDRLIRVRLDLRLGRRQAQLAIAAFALVGVTTWLSSESLTLSTTYPAPFGVYNQIVMTGNAGSVPANTTLNSNAGNTILVPPSNPGGRVGIGTAVPARNAKTHSSHSHLAPNRVESVFHPLDARKQPGEIVVRRERGMNESRIAFDLAVPSHDAGPL